MFIKVGLRDFAPATLVDLRLVLAATVLVAFVAARGRARRLRYALSPGAFVGIVGMALPFLLISWGETHIESGIAGVANASVPIFVALLALRFAPSERLHGLRLAGLAVGLSGVAVVSGVHPSGGLWAIIGTLAVVLSSLCYAASALYVQRRIGVGGPELAATSTLCGAVVMLPFAVARIPDHVGVRIRDRYPGEEAVTCVIPGHDRDGEELVADELRVDDGPLAFDYEATCGYASTFAYSGG